MIKYCLLLLSLILPITSTTTTPASMESFHNVIFENYDLYGYLLAANKKDYEVMVVTGVINDESYYGIFINNKTNNPMKAKVEAKSAEYKIDFDDRIASYPKLTFKNNYTYKLTITDTISNQTIYSESFTTDGVAQSDAFYGLGNDQLVAQKLSPLFKPQSLIQLVSIILIAIFGLIIVYIAVFKKNRNIRYPNLRQAQYESIEIIDENDIIDTTFDTDDLFNYDDYDDFDNELNLKPEKEDPVILDKDSYINHLFKLYEYGELTDEELNEELKKFMGEK